MLILPIAALRPASLVKVRRSLAATVLVMAAVSAAPVSFASAAELPPPADEVLVTESTATVEVYTPGFRRLVSAGTYGPQSEGQALSAPGVTPLSSESGSGGTSSTSGCTKVTVNNKKNTTLGFTAWIYHSWTSWCWNRSSQTVSSVTTGWYLSDVDPLHYWRGEVTNSLYFYDYGANDGHPKSAYYHLRQGNIENCVLKYGCLGAYYPLNILRSYYNGTWSWETDD